MSLEETKCREISFNILKCILVLLLANAISSSSLEMETWPLFSATRIGVRPHLSECTGFAPHSSRARTHSKWPSWAAMHKAVAPYK